MQYEATDPNEYLDNLPHDWRKVVLQQIRAMITKHGAELSEGIEYKMLCYRNGDKSIFHLNVQKAYVSLYVGNINKVPDSETLLKDLDLGKGCIRVRKSISLPETGLEEFIEKTIDRWAEGGETEC